MMTECYGNPSSLHTMGLEAERHLTAARETVAAALGAGSGEIVFTSGGTESNNLAILGAAHAHRRAGRHIITTSVEHPSVLESVKALEKDGFNATILPVDAQGVISLDELSSALRPDTILISVMHVNNETGAVMPVENIKKILKMKKSAALLHVDAVQSFGKLPLRPARAGIDLMSVSGHKIHAPKGVGALYLASGVRILPRAFGGGQEKSLRPGTEPLPLIAALAAATEALPDRTQELSRQCALNVSLRDMLTALPGVTINSPGDALPYLLNFSVEGIRSEILLHQLASQGIYVSSGSACAKGKGSHVLRAMGLPQPRVDSAIRVSFSRYTTLGNLEQLVQSVSDALRVLTRT